MTCSVAGCERDRAKRGYCNAHYKRAGKGSDLHAPIRPESGFPFWARVDQSGGIDACWPWIGATTYGYGVFGRGGKTKRAHRHVAEMAFGDLKGFFVCHACDDPGCCNPLHLFLGSHADNMADMVSKGRSQRGEGHWNFSHGRRMGAYRPKPKRAA